MAHKQLEQHPEPLIGLQHIIEYYAGENSIFWCGLCETSCANVQGVIAHVIGRQHRTGYMRQQYAQYLKVIESSTPERELHVLVEYSRIIEEAEGRHKINRRNEANLTEFMQYIGQVDTFKEDPPKGQQSLSKSRDVANPSLDSMVEDTKTSTSPTTFEPFETASLVEILHKIAMRSNSKNVTEMLKSLTSNFVTDEDEATKALEAANFLTKAVLNYRLSSSPK